MSDQKEAALAGAARYSYDNSAYRNAERWQRVSFHRRCPICDHQSWCLISSDEAVAGCMRVDRGSFKTARTRGGAMYLHRLRDDRAGSGRGAPPSRSKSSERRAAASIDYKHAVYTAFLDSLTITVSVYR